MAHLIIWNAFDSKDPYWKATRSFGPHILAQWLNSFGFKVKVIDFCASMKTSELVDITKKHIDSQTVAIGVSTTFWSHVNKIGVTTLAGRKSSSPEWVKNGRAQLEAANPRLDWILGGANSETLLQEDWIKFHEYPEDQIRKYLDEKLALNKIYTPFDICNSTNTYLDGLGLLPHDTLGIEWGRGCHFKCAFCRYKLNGKKKNTYLRDVKLVRQDLINNYERYGTTRYIYTDDTTNESVEKVQAMADVAQSLPFEIEWVGYGRLDLIGSNRSTIQTLRDSGLRSMFFGVESFNPEASKIIGKGWNGIHAKDFLLELKEIWGDEIVYTLGLIIGISPETEEEIDAAMQWCIDSKIRCWGMPPLSLTSQITNNSSEFDRNFAQYGYSFPDPNRPDYWESKYWNYDTARQKADYLEPLIWQYSRPSGFRLASIAALSGLTFSEIIKYKGSFYTETTIMESEARLANYVDYQLNVSEN